MTSETDRYQLKISSAELSIRPYFGYLMRIKIFVLVSVVLCAFVPFSGRFLNEYTRYVLYGLAGIMSVCALYDFIFLASVKFLFDKKTNTIYKIYLSSVKIRLMTFDEMTVIMASEYGEEAYAIGKKRNQFRKNYSISSRFTNTKKSQEREADYIEHILNPIHEFINTR
ncbi:hypothetical protein CLU96_2694 [Chryseobacterium sp. 52]|uniref:hypothetical protein n=1 Tax=Chryseobacterium sp. 52 TaxID=2035213 RepID=UPI000C1A55C5|nr:hypothetical protein [Chryseobacterium sp. 52]PIF45684.1 hypothetical protein CLU96_2694 [Chryseobacterium sp. 52]